MNTPEFYGDNHLQALHHVVRSVSHRVDLILELLARILKQEVRMDARIAQGFADMDARLADEGQAITDLVARLAAEQPGSAATQEIVDAIATRVATIGSLSDNLKTIAAAAPTPPAPAAPA